MKKPTTAEVDQFIERMGLSAQADGLPRIAGRIMGFFILFGGPCSFSELAQRLQVSRGSISTNARLLEGLGVIERVALPGDRQDYFQLSDDPYRQLLEGYVKRMRQTQSTVDSAKKTLAAAAPGAAERLNEIGLFYQTTVENTRSLIDNWQRLSKTK